MRNAKRIAILLACVLLFAAGCQSAESSRAAAETVDTAATAAQTVTVVSATEAIFSEVYSNRDLDASYDASEATRVDLSALTGDYTITAAGVYVFSGTLADGSILVNASDEDKVQIVLSNASITNPDGPVIYAVNADKVFLTAEDGSVNELADGSEYAQDTFGNNPDGAVFSRCDLTINGTGTISIAGNCKFGIVGKDDIVLVDATLCVTSVSDGIVGKNSVSIGSGTISVVAGGDGIVSENGDDATLGSIQIDNGEISIQTGGANADSAKGIKAQASLAINGGSITIDAEDDALHSAASLTITGGTLNLSSGDDGMHSDDTLAISGGEIVVQRSYEGIEGGTITISGGTIDVTSSDDGVNAAGGADLSAQGGPRGSDIFSADTSKSLTISGGTITINAEGDGLDSNGTLAITGGTVFISGPTNSGNGALDSAGAMTISSGVVVAAGSTGMAQGFDQNSAQASVSYTFSSAQQAGTTVTLKNASGDVIATYTPEKTYQNVVISAPDLTVGQSYTLFTGDTSVETITLSGIVTSIGSSGMNGGFGGGGGQKMGGGRHG